jgi:hypothetical protein
MRRQWNPGKFSRFETQKAERFSRSANPLREFLGSYIPKIHIEKFRSLTAVEEFVKGLGYKVTEINFDRAYIVADFEYRLHLNGYVSREINDIPF